MTLKQLHLIESNISWSQFKSKFIYSILWKHNLYTRILKGNECKNPDSIKRSRVDLCVGAHCFYRTQSVMTRTCPWSTRRWMQTTWWRLRCYWRTSLWMWTRPGSCSTHRRPRLRESEFILDRMQRNSSHFCSPISIYFNKWKSSAWFIL